MRSEIRRNRLKSRVGFSDAKALQTVSQIDEMEGSRSR